MENIVGGVGGGSSQITSAVYVSYTVQKGDTLWDIWKKTGMTSEEWMKENDSRDPDATLYAGEKITIKDPVATCRNEDGYWDAVRQTAIAVGKYDHELDVCGYDHQYNLFKPLRKYTEVLQKGGLVLKQ